jgi:hypothetical protein
MIGETDSSAAREAALAVLNGVPGDYLIETGNPLAISMRWRRDGAPLPQPVSDGGLPLSLPMSPS